MKKILLVSFALMCTIVANAQKITYSGNKVVATCEVNRMQIPVGMAIIIKCLNSRIIGFVPTYTRNILLC